MNCNRFRKSSCQNNSDIILNITAYDGTKTRVQNVAWAKGEKGDKGDKGDRGDDGITPQIGMNGNWFIGEFDTGVQSKGDKGDKGETGEKGQQGEKGDKGEMGLQGVAGATGATGSTGATGATGERGIRGEKGEQGERGATGPEVIKACNMVTLNDPTFPIPSEGIEIASNGRLPIKRAEIDTGNFCVLDSSDNTIQFNAPGTYEVLFSINGYVKATTQNFNPDTDFVSVGFRAVDSGNVYVGANSWSFENLPQSTVGFGIVQIATIADPYELVNLQKKPLLLCGGNIKETTTSSYFACPAVSIIIKKLR